MSKILSCIIAACFLLGPSLAEAKLVKAKRHRVISHQKAYKKRKMVDPYLNIKVTPPEKRGKDGYVAVEVYNYSKNVHLAMAHFWLYLETDDFMQVEAELTVENMRPNWGDIRWVKIPLRKGKRTLPKITKIRVEKMEMFGAKGKRAKMLWTTDLIKN
jgi:hypothetical protein